MIYLGDKPIKAIYKGTRLISKVYFGAILLWEMGLTSFMNRVFNDVGSYEDNDVDFDADNPHNATLAMIPKAYKEGKLYSILPEDGSGDYTFERNSTATYVDKDGIIRTAAPNVPRIDYSTGKPMVLREKESTNLFMNSDFFTNTWRVFYAAAEYSSTPSPSGTLDVLRITQNEKSEARVYIQSKITSNGDPFVFSYFVNKGNSDAVDIQVRGKDGIYRTSKFSFNTETFTTIAQGTEIAVKKYANGWYRLSSSVSGAINTGDLTETFLVGVNGGIGKYVNLWGAQLEEGSEATSYIPTNGTTVTRLADNFIENEAVLTPRNTKLITTDTESYLEINGKPTIKDTYTEKILGWQGLLAKEKIAELNPDRVAYGENDDISAELSSLQDLQPSLAMIPAKYETGVLQSLIPADGTGDFTVDRNSTATRVNKDGLIEIVPANTPRIDWSTGEPMLLVEGSVANQCKYSEPLLDNCTKGGSLSEVSMTGFTNAIRLNANDGSYVYPDSINVIEGLTYTMSCFVEAENLTIEDFSISFQTRTITKSKTEITHIKDNLYRVSVSDVASGINHYFGIRKLTSDSSKPIVASGFQKEEGSKATSYIPTNGSIVTRLLDRPYKKIAQNLIGQSEGTVVVKAHIGSYDFSADVWPYIFNISSDDSQSHINRIGIRKDQGNKIRLHIGPYAGITTNEISVGELKCAFSYNHTTKKASIAVNGNLLTNTLNYTENLSNLGLIDIGSRGNNSTAISDYIKEVKLYKIALTDAQLIELTTL